MKFTQKMMMCLSVFLCAFLIVGCVDGGTQKPIDPMEQELNDYVKNYQVPEVLSEDYVLETSQDFKVFWNVFYNQYITIEQNAQKQSVIQINKFPKDDETKLTVIGTFINGPYEQVRRYSVTIVEPKTTLKDFYNLSDGSECTVEGIVYAKARAGVEGFYIYDETASLFVYGASDDVALGQKVKIVGNRSDYYRLAQLKYADKSNITVLAEGQALPEYDPMSIHEVVSQDPNDVKSLAKNVTFEGLVVSKVEDFMTCFYLEDPITKEQVFVYYKSGQDLVGLYRDQYVRVNCVVYNYNDSKNTWEVFVDGTTKANVVPIDAPTLTVEDKLNAVGYYLESKYDQKVFFEDLALLNTDPLYQTSITWVSKNPAIIANDGKVTLPSETTQVELEATIALSGKTKVQTVTVSINPLQVKTLEEVLKNYDMASGQEVEISVEGIVVATRGTTGYFLGNNGYFLYINGNTQGYVAGDCVLVVGKLAVYKGQPQIGSPTYQRYSENTYELPEAKPLTVAELSQLDDTKATSYCQYIALIGNLKSVSGTYGNSYFIYDRTNPALSISIHAASNTAGFQYVNGNNVIMKCFIQSYEKGNWKIFATNRDGELIVEENSEVKLNAGTTYLEDILTPTTTKVNVNMELPTTHPAILDLKFEWSSNNETVLSASGVYGFPATDQTVTLTVKIKVGTTDEISRNFTYTVEGANQAGLQDLMFSSLLHGATNDKIFTIYNGTGSDIDLSEYTIASIQNTGIGSNGYSVDLSNAQGVLKLSGTIKDKETILFHHVSLNKTIVAQFPAGLQATGCPNQNGVVAFNGKDGDMLVLQKNGMKVDIIGSFEKVLSQGQSTSWEERYFGSKLLIRNKLAGPNPTLNWCDFEAVDQVWKVYAAPVAPDYVMPNIVFDFANGNYPD